MSDRPPFLNGPTGPRIVVVGGGISGLAAALRVSALLPSAHIALLEASDRLGGKIVTEHHDGFLIESGPDSFLATKPRGLGLCAELGIASSLQSTTSQPHRAYVVRRGILHELPEGLSGLVPTRLGPLFRSRLLSPAAKLRVASDIVIPPASGDADESVASFVRRRLGSEAYDWLVEPLMAGIYAGDGDRLSLLATFPQLRDAERRHGGLIRGAIASQGTAAVGPRRGFLTPIEGVGHLVSTAEAKLRQAGVGIELSRSVSRLTWQSSQWLLETSGPNRIAADAVILAVPGFIAADLLRPNDAGIAFELAAIPHASSAIVTFAFPEAELPRPLSAHGYVIPRAEGRPALASTWTSAKWSNRAPPGWALLRVFLGRFGQAATFAADDDGLVCLARAELRRTLGIETTPSITRVARWPRGMPQYLVGHRERMDRLDAALRALPGLTLAGASYRGVGLPDCIASGEAAATSVVTWLASSGRPTLPDDTIPSLVGAAGKTRL